MEGGAVMILGKLALTFGCLIGIPARELWCLRRKRRAAAAGPPAAEKNAGRDATTPASDRAPASPWPTEDGLGQMREISGRTSACAPACAAKSRSGLATVDGAAS